MSSNTLLDYVQTIMSSADMDEVNSISDTVESLQVAHVVRTAYQDIVARADLNEHLTLFELTASGDPDKPTLMSKPSDVLSILWVKYDKIEADETDKRFEKVTFLPLDEFLNRMYLLKPSDDNVGEFTHTIGTDSLTFFFRNDKAPEFFTTFNDDTIIFDSYDSEVDGTLQNTKTLCYGKKDQAFSMTDSFVPFQDKDLSTLLLNEAKILAFAELKQIGHDVAKMWADRSWTKLQKTKRAVDQDRNELQRLPNYGRK